jgi:hypothetical protein
MQILINATSKKVEDDERERTRKYTILSVTNANKNTTAADHHRAKGNGDGMYG